MIESENAQASDLSEVLSRIERQTHYANAGRELFYAFAFLIIAHNIAMMM